LLIMLPIANEFGVSVTAVRSVLTFTLGCARSGRPPPVPGRILLISLPLREACERACEPVCEQGGLRQTRTIGRAASPFAFARGSVATIRRGCLRPQNRSCVSHYVAALV
jgi:hypothetical protein